MNKWIILLQIPIEPIIRDHSKVIFLLLNSDSGMQHVISDDH